MWSEQASRLMLVALSGQTKTSRPPARDRPHPALHPCKQQSRRRYRLPCSAMVRRRLAPVAVGCSSSSDSAASGCAKRCARTAPCQQAGVSPLRSWSSSFASSWGAITGALAWATKRGVCQAKGGLDDGLCAVDGDEAGPGPGDSRGLATVEARGAPERCSPGMHAVLLAPAEAVMLAGAVGAANRRCPRRWRLGVAFVGGLS